MKTLLMCDALVGSAIAEWLLLNYPADLGAIVTTSENDTSRAARKKNVPTFVFESEEQLTEDLSGLAAFDIGLLAWWPKLVSPSILALSNGGFLNTHPSLLPHNRGKHYNFWALVEQVPFGVSLHFVDAGIDSGDIVAQRVIPYGWEDTGETLYGKAARAMIELFKSAYPDIRSGQISRTPQDLTQGSLHYAKDINPASVIDLDQTYTARALLNLLRARTFAGHPACSFEEDGQVYEVRVNIERKST
ncbi:MAG: formyltransferase family protein [Moraxellaceae bacterium]|nr:formyltransferase family protein [Moraxellaceae bacterium]